MMYGTVARIRVMPGKESELMEVTEEWSRERGVPSGQIAEYLFKTEGQEGEYLSVAIFPDRETYINNANHPGTDRWYRRMRELLQADPEWNDGEIVKSIIFNGI